MFVSILERSYQSNSRAAHTIPSTKAIHIKVEKSIPSFQQTCLERIFSATAPTSPLRIKMQLVPKLKVLTDLEAYNTANQLQSLQAKFWNVQRHTGSRKTILSLKTCLFHCTTPLELWSCLIGWLQNWLNPCFMQSVQSQLKMVIWWGIYLSMQLKPVQLLLSFSTSSAGGL